MVNPRSNTLIREEYKSSSEPYEIEKSLIELIYITLNQKDAKTDTTDTDVVDDPKDTEKK